MIFIADGSLEIIVGLRFLAGQKLVALCLQSFLEWEILHNMLKVSFSTSDCERLSWHDLIDTPETDIFSYNHMLNYFHVGCIMTWII